MNVLVLFIQMMFYVGLHDYVTYHLHVNLLSIYVYSLLSILCSFVKPAQKSRMVRGSLTLSVDHFGIVACIP
ncbi:hypothetical protein F383_38221 [Gossypium arboreum]|uniref:Uncharacterized protein n=1 Tax=Gossypium arboreum TaxID=29729 RepID=A0A0B0MIK3_GOSAR|nr:hypothetical protein F383_38221 [Gossypium arboreum]